MTVAPSSRSISATVDFPEPTPPVRPITFMELGFGAMADEEKFDAVVVGAGPAGTAAAITMAKAGPMVVPETVVERLIVKNNRVVGVATGRGDDLYCEVVVVCEGIGLGAGLLEKTVINGRPLRRKLRANEVAMAAKEIMQLEPG